MGVKKKIKLILIGIWGLFLLSVGAYAANSAYKNYQETQIKQAKEQHKNEQIELAKDKVKKVVDDKISGVNCKAKYDLKNISDDSLTITVTFDDSKNTVIGCEFKRADNSLDFNDENSFGNAIDKFINEEKTSEIRHTIIYDYQDMLYGMRGKTSNRWDKVKFSKNDNDYIVQETSDRFFGGSKAYLVTIDSEWITKNGKSEWKHICLHMEYDSNNKLIDAKYGDYDKINLDNDIKNGVKADDSLEKKNIVENNMSASSETSKSQITSDEARKIILKEDGNYISKVTKKDEYNQYGKLENDYKEYSAENMPTRNGWNIPKEPFYEFCVKLYNNKGEFMLERCRYLVGKESKKIYCMPNQGGMPAYEIENNQKVKIFKYNGKEISSVEWR